jgi:hypothetical protein
MLMKPPAPARRLPNLLTLTLPSVALRQAEHREVEAAAVVEVELIGLVDHGLGVDRRAEVQPAGRDAADHARLGAQGDEVDDALLGRHRRHALGHADAQVHQFAGAQLQRRAPRDDLARPGGHRRHLGQRHAQAPGVGRRVGRGEGLRVLLGALGPHHAVDQHAGHLDLAGLQAAALGHLLHLGDDDAAAVVRGHRQRQGLERQRLALQRQVAVQVGRGGADQRDLDREGLVEQRLLAVDVDQPHQLVGGLRVELAAAQARVDEGTEADARQVPRSPRGDVAVEMGDDALRQVPGLDASFHRQLLQLGHQAPMPADHPATRPSWPRWLRPRSAPSPWPAA